MEEVELVFPTLKYKSQALEMIEEAKKYDSDSNDIFAGYSSLEKYTTYEEWLQKLKRDLNYNNISPNRVPASTYFLVRQRDSYILGIVNIRHFLNDYLKKYGGYIGYSIRYTERQKGYGKKQLLLAFRNTYKKSINNL